MIFAGLRKASIPESVSANISVFTSLSCSFEIFRSDAFDNICSNRRIPSPAINSSTEIYGTPSNFKSTVPTTASILFLRSPSFPFCTSAACLKSIHCICTISFNAPGSISMIISLIFTAVPCPVKHVVIILCWIHPIFFFSSWFFIKNWNVCFKSA